MTLLKTSVVLLLSIISFSACSEKDKTSTDITQKQTVSAEKQSSKDTQESTKASEIYQFVEVKKRTDDDNSPMGYWEIDLSYPKVDIPGKADVSSTINTSIESLVNQYTCDDGGDKTFTASEVQIDKTSLSFEYESMWMCSTMPSPDYDSGTVSYDLTTGDKISK